VSKVILKTMSLVVDGVDLSKRCTQVAIDMPDEEVDLTTFQATNKQTGKGLGDASIAATFIQDYAASQVDETLWPLKNSEEPFFVEVKPFSGAKSATNPLYKQESLMFGYTPVSGTPGQASTIQVTFKNVGSQGIERIIS